MAKVFSGITHSVNTYASGDDGREVDRIISGPMRGRIFFDEIQYTIEFEWSMITLADKNSIESDYNTNKDVEFEVDISDSAGNLTTYDQCQWIQMPIFRPSAKTGGRWNGVCTIWGYQQ